MNFFGAVFVFICGELFALVIFSLLKKSVKLPEDSPARKGAIARGVLERLTLLTGLLFGFHQVLIAFGALKIGTRLKEELESHISSSYFLLGNLFTILLAMVDAIAIRNLFPLVL